MCQNTSLWLSEDESLPRWKVVLISMKKKKRTNRVVQLLMEMMSANDGKAGSANWECVKPCAVQLSNFTVTTLQKGKEHLLWAKTALLALPKETTLLLMIPSANELLSFPLWTFRCSSNILIKSKLSSGVTNPKTNHKTNYNNQFIYYDSAYTVCVTQLCYVHSGNSSLFSGQKN